MVVPLFFQSEEALTLLNRSGMENNLIGCAYPRASLPKDPIVKDFLSIGTACRILELVRLPNRGMKVFIEGLSRVLLQNMVQEVSYIRADVKEVVDSLENHPLSETLVQSIGTIFKIFLSSGKPLSNDVLKTLDKIDHPGRLADLITITLRPGLKDQQEIFETIDPLERLKKSLPSFQSGISSFSIETPILFFPPQKSPGDLIESLTLDLRRED